MTQFVANVILCFETTMKNEKKLLTLQAKLYY